MQYKCVYFHRYKLFGSGICAYVLENRKFLNTYLGNLTNIEEYKVHRVTKSGFTNHSNFYLFMLIQ